MPKSFTELIPCGAGSKSNDAPAALSDDWFGYRRKSEYIGGKLIRLQTCLQNHVRDHALALDRRDQVEVGVVQAVRSLDSSV